MSTSPKLEDSIVIKQTGSCIEKYLAKLKKTIGPGGADEAKETAAAVVKNCVLTYSNIFGSGDVGSPATAKVAKLFPKGIPNGTTGLLYGKVQSGKTKTAIATIAMAVENGFRCFIFLTSDNTWLGKQTAARIKNGLVGGPVVFHWEEWHSDPAGFAKAKIKPYLGDTGVVLISTKNASHLKNLKTVLSKAGADDFPAIFIDDEADNASLNTNQAKQAAGTTTEPSTIFKLIGGLRTLMPNHVYVQVTATPQSLLLQDLNHPCKPVFCNLSMPGEKYMGGEVFFSLSSPHCCEVDSNEVLQLKSGKVSPGTAWSIPEGLRKALCCFFVGYAAKVKELGNIDEPYSFLAHICHKKISHQNIGNVITSFVIDLDKAIREKLSPSKAAQAEKWLKEAYAELTKTNSKMPPLAELLADLRDTLRNAIPEIINADNPHEEPQYRPGMNILVGGNRLGRGVTIDGLFITYYGRDAKQKTMDTVHQHARMFGYRKPLEDITRLFIPTQVLADFKMIYESDEGMRKAIGDDPTHDIKIKPVWLGPAIKPTRSNVLNLSEIDAFSPGTAIFPPDPTWKKGDIKQHTAALDTLLALFKGDDKKLHPVDLDLMKQVLAHMPSKHMTGYKWEDKRVIEALSAMKSHGIKEGFLNVRCGKDGLGLELQRQVAPFKSFADDAWVQSARAAHPKAPVLIVMMEKGLKSQKWDDCRIYLPTLVLPSTGFVFMFNYT